MGVQFTDTIKILDAKATTGAGDGQLVTDFTNLILALDTASSANLTVKFQGSISDTEPDWTAAQSATNQWDYVQVKDLEDGSSLDGDNGFVVSGTDDHRMFEVNTNRLKWFNAIVTARAAGSVTAQAFSTTNM